MNATVAVLPSIRVIMIRHVGPYDGIGPAFDRLWNWMESNGVPLKRIIGIYYDNPDYVAANQLRSAACYEVGDDFQMPDRGGLPIELTNIPGGEYATTRFVGPYEKLDRVWTDLTNYCERDLKRMINEQRPAFEVYVNDASETPADQLITELYMPLE